MVSASLIIPIRNEEKSVEKLIKSILNQTIKPKEIIFVDGYSNDGTSRIIQKYVKINKFIKYFLEPKTEKKGKIAVARNFAISKAKTEYIVCVDSGCILESNWFENMIKPFDKGYDVVVGNYQPLINSDFDYFQSLVSVNSVIDSKGEIILSRASSRSLAFKKEFWMKAGRYPEDTYTGEDTKYNYNLKKIGAKFYYAKNAKLYWNMRSDIKSFWKQYYLYGKGDSLSKNIFNLRTNLIFFILLNSYILVILIMLFMIPFISLILLLLFIIIFFILGLFLNFKSKDSKHFLKGLYWLPLLLFFKRISYFLGLWKGFL